MAGARKVELLMRQIKSFDSAKLYDDYAPAIDCIKKALAESKESVSDNFPLSVGQKQREKVLETRLSERKASCWPCSYETAVPFVCFFSSRRQWLGMLI